MPCRPTMYRDPYGVPVARQEWEQVRRSNSMAANFFAARLQQVALAPNGEVEAFPDLYDYNSGIYCYDYEGFAMYYTIEGSRDYPGSDVVMLVCGDYADRSLNQLAHDRKASL